MQDSALTGDLLTINQVHEFFHFINYLILAHRPVNIDTSKNYLASYIFRSRAFSSHPDTIYDGRPIYSFPTSSGNRWYCGSSHWATCILIRTWVVSCAIVVLSLFWSFLLFTSLVYISSLVHILSVHSKIRLIQDKFDLIQIKLEKLGNWLSLFSSYFSEFQQNI